MDLVRKSKKLSWLLRHGALEARLPMDEAGWASIADVLRHTGLTRPQLDRVVAENNKSRLEVRGDRVRCSQGHSLEGMPVTLDALEASWTRLARTAPLFHGTRLDLVEPIVRGGIQPMGRTHVHLADSPDSTVGKRASVAVLLEVDPERLEGLWVSANGVYLTRRVPSAAIVGFRPVTRRAHEQAPQLRALIASRT
ncbi:MAG: RNA 2'-phosphotransferase [Alphaproteobacteria bacterium]|nr:RNA 2'-phosphotransferase [Alphaproteobacteria bacterium]